MGNKDEKTNVLRILDQKKVPYKSYSYDCGASVPTGVECAAIIGKDVDTVFKTLVTVGKSKGIFIFVIPVAKELNLKLAASAAGEKSIEMIRSKDLMALTGYVHGGCSPIGMKKPFPTFVDESAKGQGSITFSAGKIGHQVEIAPEDLEKLVHLTYVTLCE